MNPFKCRHCSRDAHFYFREGGMLCPDHGALHATTQMKDLLERSRLDKSVSELCTPDWSVDPQINRASCAEAGLCARPAPKGSISGDRTAERFSETATEGQVCSLDPSLLVTAGRDRQPNSPPTVLSPLVAGALADTPLPVTAGAAFSDDLPIFPGRKNATTFRVTADNSIQESM